MYNDELTGDITWEDVMVASLTVDKYLAMLDENVQRMFHEYYGEDVAAALRSEPKKLMRLERILPKIAEMHPRAQQVLVVRFGLADGKPKTLEETAKEFGVTRERVRQIEAQALRRGRHAVRKGKLSDIIPVVKWSNSAALQ